MADDWMDGRSTAEHLLRWRHISPKSYDALTSLYYSNIGVGNNIQEHYHVYVSLNDRPSSYYEWISVGLYVHSVW